MVLLSKEKQDTVPTQTSKAFVYGMPVAYRRPSILCHKEEGAKLPGKLFHTPLYNTYLCQVVNES